jgi:hypothetical protein
MIVEALGLATLAAASFSDTDRRKFASMAAMGQWKKLHDILGDHAYHAYVSRLPESPARQAALKVLENIYLPIVKFEWESEGEIEFDDGAQIRLGEKGAWVAGWMWVYATDRDEGGFDDYPEVAIDWWRRGFIKPAYRSSSGLAAPTGVPGDARISLDEEPQVSRGDDPGAYVQAFFWANTPPVYP